MTVEATSGPTTSPAFRALHDVFDTGLRKQRGGGAAFAATVNGEQVVSLWGGSARPGVAWRESTPAVVMSVTKGWAAMCIQLLVDRGQLSVDDLVADHWPEYACNGKERTTVRHVLLHQAGVVGLPGSEHLLSWDGRGWSDREAISAALASAAPAWEPGSASGYHAITYGWLLAELVHRITGRTLGEFFAAEVAGPLGIGTAIGVDEARMADVAVVTGDSMRGPLLARPLMGKVAASMRDPRTLLGQAFLADGTRSIMDAAVDLLRLPVFFRAVIPSSNGISRGADLARLYAVLANDGQGLLSPGVVKAFAAPALDAEDAVFVRSCTFLGGSLLTKRTRSVRSLGYTLNEPAAGKRRYGPDPRSFGSEGAGGQLAFADPGRRVSVGFVRSALSDSPAFALELVETLYRCLA
jgi:CubicO group peptidase (beta-lactamase class C family)